MEWKKLLKKYTAYCRKMINLFFAVLFISVTGSDVFAHKVNIFGYVEGNTVYTQSYFSDGRKCVKSKVEVFGNAGDKLLEGTTDNIGEFSFKVPAKKDLKLVLTASMGHRAEYILSADELRGSESLGMKPKVSEKDIKENIKPKDIEMSQVGLDQIRSVVAETIDEKLAPLFKLVAKSQQDGISVTEVIGGIGYIFGLMGVAIYFKNKK